MAAFESLWIGSNANQSPIPVHNEIQTHPLPRACVMRCGMFLVEGESGELSFAVSQAARIHSFRFESSACKSWIYGDGALIRISIGNWMVVCSATEGKCGFCCFSLHQFA